MGNNYSKRKMLSKAFRPNNNSLFRTIRRAYGTKPNIFQRVFNTVNEATHAQSIVKHDPLQPLSGHQVVHAEDRQQQYNMTPLNNGFTVLTESASFPGAVHMGKYHLLYAFNIYKLNKLSPC